MSVVGRPESPNPRPERRVERYNSTEKVGAQKRRLPSYRGADVMAGDCRLLGAQSVDEIQQRATAKFKLGQGKPVQLIGRLTSFFADDILDSVVEALDEIVDPLPLFHHILNRAVQPFVFFFDRFPLGRPKRRRRCFRDSHVMTSPRRSAFLSTSC
jgi:hypothetical protein